MFPTGFPKESPFYLVYFYFFRSHYHCCSRSLTNFDIFIIEEDNVPIPKPSSPSMAFAKLPRPPLSPSFHSPGASRYLPPRPPPFFALSQPRAADFSSFKKPHRRVKAEQQESGVTLAADVFANIKHVLLPITDRNPFLSEGTRQVLFNLSNLGNIKAEVCYLCMAAVTTASLAKKYGAEITVVVIDDKPKESIPDHDSQISSIRWHLSEGGFKEFRLLERLGEEKKPTSVIGEVADDLNLDLVVLSMEAIHSKHVDGNLLAEFTPCPVLLLPL